LKKQASRFVFLVFASPLLLFFLYLAGCLVEAYTSRSILVCARSHFCDKISLDSNPQYFHQIVVADSWFAFAALIGILILLFLTTGKMTLGNANRLMGKRQIIAILATAGAFLLFFSSRNGGFLLSSDFVKYCATHPDTKCPENSVSQNKIILSDAAHTVIVRADFGIFSFDKFKKLMFTPTAIVPATVDQAYGWILFLHTTEPTIKWREELQFSEKPMRWESPPAPATINFSKDGRTISVESEVSSRGLIYHGIVATTGDPKGPATIRLFVNDQLVRIFNFEIQ